MVRFRLNFDRNVTSRKSKKSIPLLGASLQNYLLIHKNYTSSTQDLHKKQKTDRANGFLNMTNRFDTLFRLRLI